VAVREGPGVSGSNLIDVEIRNYGSNVRLRRAVRAERCEVVVRTAQRMLELRCYGGTVDYSGAKAPIPSTGYAVRIAGIDPEAWRRAGLTILRVEP
jgi:hypothetical protein